VNKSERAARAAILRKRRSVVRELRELSKRLDASARRAQFYEHPPFRIGSVCWG
jgi:hypothetical protein